MIDSKLLAMAFNKSVPDEVKKAGKVHLDNLQAIDNAQAQMDKGKAAKLAAQAAADQSEQALIKVLSAWDPNAAVVVAQPAVKS